MIQLAKHRKLIVTLFVLNFLLSLVDGLIPRWLAVLSLLLLPLSTVAFVIGLSRKWALCVLGSLCAFFCFGSLVWGFAFLFLVPVWIGLMIPVVVRTWWSWLLCLIVVALGIQVLPLPALASPLERAGQDQSNIKQITLAVGLYREAHQAFPDKLSQLQDFATSVKIFMSARGAGEVYALSGPFYRWLHEPYPGPSKFPSWSEVDGGDYLYRKPSTNAPGTTILVMTRPGLLSQGWVNVGFVDGHVERLKPSVWKRRADAVNFLKQTGVTSP